MQDKTIAAISTPMGVGGIAVIRMSGENSIELADHVFKGSDKLTNAASHTVHYGHIVAQNGEVIDEVLAVKTPLKNDR